MAERYLSLVLHDVTPHSWADYRPFVDAVDALGSVPITWLVVPDFHHCLPLTAFPDFCAQLQCRLDRGDELVLHGYWHCDYGPVPGTPWEWWVRRVYTREGEFQGLDQFQAWQRLQAGRVLFRRLGWPLHGFVAPAWLMSPGTRLALSESGLQYCSDRQHLYRLPDFRPYPAPGLVWSARSPWRRGLSWLLSESAARLYRSAVLLRLGLHPVDMRHDFSRRYWWQLLLRQLEQGRIPVTKIDWLSRHGADFQAES
ncbi:MAG: polysaccharide deacetylase family protein [Pseudomonadota bacterium]